MRGRPGHPSPRYLDPDVVRLPPARRARAPRAAPRLGRGERRGRHANFAVQCAAWGAIDLAIAGLAWRGLALRDVHGATKLDRLLWLNTGLDVGYVAVGVALAAVGWQLGRRLGLVGAGLGVVVQGLALLVLDAHFIAVINRLTVR